MFKQIYKQSHRVEDFKLSVLIYPSRYLVSSDDEILCGDSGNIQTNREKPATSIVINLKKIDFGVERCKIKY